jgi:single-strand DNA-binding protein
MFKTQIIGNVGKDAEVKTTPSGLQIIEFTVAHTWKTKTEEKTTWIRCKKFVQADKTAALADYIHKGDKIFVEGRADVSAYIGKDGSAQASFDLIANEIELLQRRTDPNAAPQTKPAPRAAGYASAEIEDLPF